MNINIEIVHKSWNFNITINLDVVFFLIETISSNSTPKAILFVMEKPSSVIHLFSQTQQ